jgi:hypothetical protein
MDGFLDFTSLAHSGLDEQLVRPEWLRGFHGDGILASPTPNRAWLLGVNREC